MRYSELRSVRVEGDLAFVPLSAGYETRIDVASVPLVDGHNWYAKQKPRRDGSIRAVYAVRREPDGSGKFRTISMHRVIAGTPDGMETDHIDCDGLNNTLSNLRIAKRSENAKNLRMPTNNKSGFKGVCFSAKKWRASIVVEGKQHNLGRFDCVHEAAAAYAEASVKYHGAFGRV